jgi:hypothetical protein
MLEFIMAPIACVIVLVIMILMVEFNIESYNRKTKEWEAIYAPKNQERYQRSDED